MSANKFYITTAIPYVNAAPHVGHALEFIQADVIARYHRLLGDNVLLLSGGDENALKNVQAAEKAGVPLQQFIDTNAELFRTLASKLSVQFDVFQKGSDTTHHYPASQQLWKLCEKNEDIYQQSYEGLYCVGCEAFYAPDELDKNGECLEHPGKKLDKVSEKNYFFRLSRYQQPLIDLISSNALTIIPEFRKNEILSFLKQPLRDISISRSNERAKNWGVPVPGDTSQRIYVWFDALNIYQSGVGFGWDEATYKKWWPADVHVIGKGITRFHAIYWPAFLLSAGLKPPKSLFVHEYFTVNGQKMSKTLGNVIDPFELIQKYGADALRYYFLAKFSPFNDGDFSEEKFKRIYNADLANGLGNALSRVAQLASQCENIFHPWEWTWDGDNVHFNDIKNDLNNFRLNNAISIIWGWITDLNARINQEAPWKLNIEDKYHVVDIYVNEYILKIAAALKPFMPKTSNTIESHFKNKEISPCSPLFPTFK